jgi:hypothetical protein
MLRLTRFIPLPTPRHAPLLVALALPALPALARAQGVTVRDAWVREAAAGRAVTAAFLTLANAGDRPIALVRGTASVGDTLELHEMKRDGAMMRMSPVQRIEVPAKGETALRPGDLHLMIFGLKAPLAPNDTVRLTLTFDNGSTVKVAAPVRAAQRTMP